jgi:hypothetical protein
MEGNRNNCGSMIGKFVGSALAAKFVGQNCMIATIGADEYAWFNGVNRFKYWFRTKVLTNARSIYNDGNYGIGNNVHDRTSFEFNWLYFWNKKTCGGG